MSSEKYIEKAKSIRGREPMPNCTETILMTYSDEIGLLENQARELGTNFGGGMKTGSVCGAVTGALMVMGLMQINDVNKVSEFQRKIKENHAGNINCADLLRANYAAGGEKRPHCDKMIFEAIELIEKYRDGK